MERGVVPRWCLSLKLILVAPKSPGLSPLGRLAYKKGFHTVSRCRKVEGMSVGLFSREGFESLEPSLLDGIGLVSQKYTIPGREIA